MNLKVNTMIMSTTKNVKVRDEFGNIIVVPAGFKITMDAKNVLEGIEQAKARIKANVNFDLLMELLLLIIKEN